MRLVIPIFTVLLCSGTAVGQEQTIYYGVFEGKNYEKETWHSTKLREFQANRPDNVFENYTLHKEADGTCKVKRECTTPSGDWMLYLTYKYGANGRLRQLESDFRTFVADPAAEGNEGGVTRCLRVYDVSSGGKLEKKSENITDAKTGRKVVRRFFDPEVKHWMSLRDLPLEPKT